MPRYNYLCENCEDTVTVFHGINEVYTDCESCNQTNTMKKQLSIPLFIKEQNADEPDKNVGD